METPIGPFIVCVSPEQLRKEKEKAAQLRASQWWKRQIAKGQCHYCHRKTPLAELTMDHIVALIRGGKSSRGNVVAACRECNSRKKYLLPLEWAEYLGRLSAQTHEKSREPGCAGKIPESEG
jgi:5-methylcytosine-specific restriction endonuclease McrA